MVRLEHIGKRYPAGTAALSDVSLEIEAGGFYCLTGSGGAGKTELLQIITLAEPPSQGRLRLFDTDTATLDRAARAILRGRIGIVFQELRLIDRLSAHDNIAVPLRLAGVAETQVRDNVPELLAWLGLAERADTPAASLSASERQLVAVGRAIVGRPELLVADEPAGQVDAETALALVRVFERINQLGTTVLLATRDPVFADRFPHRWLHLDGGTLTSGGGFQAQP